MRRPVNSCVSNDHTHGEFWVGESAEKYRAAV
jgi:hypothetical protein